MNLGTITYVILGLIAAIHVCSSLYYAYHKRKIVKNGNDFDLDSDSSYGYGRLYRQYVTSLKGKEATTDYSSDVINLDTVAREYKFNLHLLHIIPNILTALGILGTFLGLSLAVKSFDSSSSEAIRSSIRTLLSGMGTAFWTSVGGMSSSMIFLVQIKAWMSKIDGSLNNVCSKIDGRYHVAVSRYIENAFCMDCDEEIVTPAAFLTKIEKGIKGVKNSLDTFTTDLYDSIGNALDENFRQKIVPILNELAVKLENPAQALTDDLIKQFQALSGSFSDKLTSDVNDRMDELLERFIDASNSINTIPETLFAVNEQLLESRQQVMEAGSGLMSAIDSQTRQLTDVSKVFSAVFEKVNATLADIASLHDRLKELPNGIAAALDAISTSSTALNESNNLTKESIKNMVSVNARVSEQITRYLSEVNLIQNGIQGVFAEIKDGLTQYAEVTKKSVQSMMTPFADSVTKATENVANAIAPLNDALDDLNVFKANINSSLTQLNETLAPLAASLEKLMELRTIMESVASTNTSDHEKNEF